MGSLGTKLVTRDEIPVLIIGGGPTGLLTAALLDRLGVKSLIIERHATRLTAPKAHALGPRSLEILRQYGFDVPKIRQHGTPRDSGRWVHFVTTLAGEKLGELPYERMDAEVLEHTPEMFHNVPQPAVEHIIAESLAGSVEIRRNHSFVSCTQDESGVYSVIEDRETGQHYTIKSTYVVACDGAKSKVRRHMGIESDGEGSDLYLMTIEIDADIRPIVQDKLAILYWIINPVAHGTIIGYDLSKKQVMTCNFDPKVHPLETWDEAKCRGIVDAVLGTTTDYAIKSFRPWIMRRQVARTYRGGRVFLAGDAAHSFPPSAGIGLNSAVGDVHNLCWKLAAVLGGWAPDALLDSYGSERRGIAEINSIQSVRNGKKIYSLIKELSFSGLPPDTAWRNIQDTLRDPLQRELMMEKIQERAENFDNLELHIGYVYGSKEVPSSPSAYHPKYVPGARLPHLWIMPTGTTPVTQGLRPVDLHHVCELSSDDRQLRKYSTLDICRLESFTLIINSTAGQLQRATELQTLLRNGALASGKPPPLHVVILGKDFRIIFPEKASEWLRCFNLGEGGAGGVLVRPDQHILRVFDKNTKAQELATEVQCALRIKT
ncbi:3-propionate hydroxylase [Xylariales sp. PMI_506]|nr:3-propionate hydroxylase [Xylariales sp. PMI_506]